MPFLSRLNKSHINVGTQKKSHGILCFPLWAYHKKWTWTLQNPQGFPTVADFFLSAWISIAINRPGYCYDLAFYSVRISTLSRIILQAKTSLFTTVYRSYCDIFNSKATLSILFGRRAPTRVFLPSSEGKKK